MDCHVKLPEFGLFVKEIKHHQIFHVPLISHTTLFKMIRCSVISKKLSENILMHYYVPGFFDLFSTYTYTTIEIKVGIISILHTGELNLKDK
jgi:hypothetical protein